MNTKRYPFINSTTENAYWSHKGSGDVYAIRIFGGEIQEVSGPIDAREQTKANLVSYNFRGEPEDIAWIKEFEHDFVLCEEPYYGDQLTEGQAI